MIELKKGPWNPQNYSLRFMQKIQWNIAHYLVPHIMEAYLSFGVGDVRSVMALLLSLVVVIFMEEGYKNSQDR